MNRLIVVPAIHVFDDLEKKLKKKIQSSESLSSLSEKLGEDVQKAKADISSTKDSIPRTARDMTSSDKEEGSSASV